MISSSLGAMESLLGKLHKLLNSPPEHQLPPKSLKEGMIEHLTRLTWDLEEINRLLVDLARVKGPNAMAKRWMNEVRELSYDMEDYIDSTMRSNMTASSGMNKEILPEVRKFRTLVKQAHERHQRYELRRWASKNPASCVVHGKGQLPSFEGKATDLVGIGEPRDELIRWLKNIDEAEGKLKVVSILGPAGVGKSTLAQEVYREIGVQFERRAFVRASRVPDTRRLLRSIISQVHRHQRRPPCGLPVQELVNNLRTHLQQKRYFILIDGLWETMSWDIIKKAFPEGIYGSRILVVTDIVEVALECCDHHYNTTTWATEPQLDSGPHFHNSQVGIFQMEKLSTDDSLELFLNKVFGSKNELSEQLKMYAEEIIRKCSGLPLAIITIASVLACQPENSDLWRHIVECLSSRNTLTSEELLREIIGLSYYSLSQELKTCLLYLSLYPEGYTFKVDLVKQWTAEGFITAVADKDMNEVAEFYFDELVSRGFVQHNLNFSDDVMFYTVHSTIFEVIKRKSIEENFTTVIDYSETIPKLSAKVRRLSLSFSNAKYATKPEGFKLSPVRSLAFYGLAECLPSIMEFKLLRVLVLEFWGDRKEFDLSGIFILLQLRYVRVTSDMIIKLPAKMQGLQYLETLEIYASVLTVPSDIVHLPKLLHLHLQGDIKLPDYVGKLKSLRTLEYFDLSSNTEGNVRSLCEMTNLQHLHITCSAAPSSDHLERNLIALASLIGGLKSLKSLTIAPLCVPCSSIYMDCSSVVSSLPYCLEKFELLPPICMFSRLPVWIGQLQNLRVLKIVVRELRRDDVNRIAGLQALTVLSLYVRQPNAESIVFNSATFPVLKYLKFRCGVLRLAFQAEAMPNLRRLKLEFNAHSGEKYRDMLAGIEHLLNLQEIAVRIGAAPGAEESDKAAAESAFMDTIGKHSKHLCFRVRNADTFEEEGEQFSDKADDIEPMCSQESTVRIGAAPGAEEPAGRAGQSVSRDTSFSIQTAADPVPVDEEIQQFSDPAASSSNSDRVLPRSIMTDVTYQSNEIVDPKAANDPEIQTDPHRGVPKFGNWVAEGDEHYTQYFENARKGKSPTWERRGSSERNRRTAPNTPRIPNRRPSGCAYETVQPERASAMPKFGEWETTSDSNDGYYHIFNKVREERISAERDRKYNDNTVLASAGAASYSDSNDGYSAIFERASEKRTAGRDRKYGDNAVTTGAGSGGYNHSNQSLKKKNHSNQGRKHKSACCSCFSCFED